jgi:hypothetical protein
MLTGIRKFPMGHVSQLTVLSASYPETISSLERTERMFVLAIRGWVAGYRQGEDPLPHLCEVMRSAGAHDAAFSVDRLMAVVARTARRTIAIHCQRCPYLSNDEKHLLHAVN